MTAGLPKDEFKAGRFFFLAGYTKAPSDKSPMEGQSGETAGR